MVAQLGRDKSASRRRWAKTAFSCRPNTNLIDQIWTDRPDPPNAQAYAYPDDYAGETHIDKRKRLAKMLRDNAQDTAILTLPDSIVWLLNMRGSDVTHVPLVHSFAFLHADASVDLFIAPGKAEHLSRAFWRRDTPLLTRSIRRATVAITRQSTR